MSSPATAPGALGAAARFFRVDLPGLRRQPRPVRLLIATAVAIVGSVAACALLATLGPVVFPATRGYGHFQFADYTKLTVIGVVLACLGWPICAALSSHARRLYFWAAVAITIVSFAPDVWIWWQGQIAEGVLVLAVMHVAVAVVTYLAVVLLAPQADRAESAQRGMLS